MPPLPMGPPMGAPPPMPMGPPGMDPMMGGGLPPPPLVSPAESAGMAAAALVPQQAAAMQAMTEEVLAALMSQFASVPNAAAEAAQSEPAPQVAPGMGAGVPDPNDPYAGV